MTRTTLRGIGAVLVGVSTLLAGVGLARADQPLTEAVSQSLQRLKGGLVVFVGCGEEGLAAGSSAGPSFLVQMLERDEKVVRAQRERLLKRGVYGRVSVRRWDGGELPYVDNSVNLVVVGRGVEVAKNELLRVLAPRGVALVESRNGVERLTKPWPDEYDQWPQYLHDSTNNAVSKDRAIGPPRHLQWTGGPKWSRHHDHMSSCSAMVSAGGRVFYIFDHGPYVSILLPSRWQLVARDAFNGKVLWRRPIERWHSQIWSLKSGPAQLPRRLVATADTVYVTLSIDGPVTALSAADGTVLRTYEETRGTDEIVYCDGVLYLVVDQQYAWPGVAPKRNKYWWQPRPRTLLAVRAEDGTVLWKQTQPWIAPLSLTVGEGKVLFYDGERVVCLEQKSGKELWRSERLGERRPLPSYFGPTLVLHDGVVLFSGAEAGLQPNLYHVDNGTTLFALDAASGKTLWQAPHAPCGYRSPEDVFVIDDLVWFGALMWGKNREDFPPAPWGKIFGLDLRTGETKVTFGPNVRAYWFHHRCYRARATERYLLTSRTGIEFIDLKSHNWQIHHWVRGACLYGILPANGLIYVAPHPCACYLEAKLYGFNALAPESAGRAVPESVRDELRLERGPAFGQVELCESSGPNEWPTYRHDPARSGSSPVDVGADVRPSWRRHLGGRLTAPVVAGGLLLVARIDAHTLYALDARSGRPLWSYTAGGRIDSPPTFWRGLVLFGSADGWVYCLRGRDGQLVWRFRAAPLDRQLVAYEQLESVWPVHGSVLVDQEGTVWCVAGRSAFLDGGLRLLRLDARTGQKRQEEVLDDRVPGENKTLQQILSGLNMPVALPDVLSADDQYVYIRSQRFRKRDARREALDTPLGKARDQKGEGAHLFSPTGFLDDSYWHRSYWVYGKRWKSGAGGYYVAGRYAPAGRILVFDQQLVYGYGRKPEFYRWTTPMERQLFACSKSPKVVRIRPPDRRPGFKATRPVDERIEFRWTKDVPIYVKALIKAADKLFLAGPPEIIDEKDVYRNYPDPQTQELVKKQSKLFDGDVCKLLVVRARDGQRLAEYELPTQTVWDGMAAAYGKLYVSLKNGEVLCLTAD